VHAFIAAAATRRAGALRPGYRYFTQALGRAPRCMPGRKPGSTRAGTASTSPTRSRARRTSVAVGADYLDACPVRGVRIGGGGETLQAEAHVEASQQ
jgi:hypothetical protein